MSRTTVQNVGRWMILILFRTLYRRPFQDTLYPIPASAAGNGRKRVRKRPGEADRECTVKDRNFRCGEASSKPARKSKDKVQLQRSTGTSPKPSKDWIRWRVREIPPVTQAYEQHEHGKGDGAGTFSESLAEAFNHGAKSVRIHAKQNDAFTPVAGDRELGFPEGTGQFHAFQYLAAGPAVTSCCEIIFSPADETRSKGAPGDEFRCKQAERPRARHCDHIEKRRKPLIEFFHAGGMAEWITSPPTLSYSSTILEIPSDSRKVSASRNTQDVPGCRLGGLPAGPRFSEPP